MSSKSLRGEEMKRLAQSMGLDQIYKRDEDLSFIQIENCIGYAKVPIGLAGPLRITGPGVNDRLYGPLATCEATLVAACSRGCKAFESSGGVHFDVFGEGMSRDPVFRFENPQRAIEFYRAAPAFRDEFAKWAESTSRFVRLQEFRPAVIGSNVHIVCRYTCGDAVGQNMVTKATGRACDMLREAYGDEFCIRGFFIEGQLASDKNPSWGNVFSPRGVQAMAWGTINAASCQEILGCTTQQWFKLWNIAVDGATRQGHFGCNMNTANIVAALFTSTGQDTGSVAEASWSQLVCELDDETKNMTLSLFFPSLPVGTVGGGTGYATQKEALGILGCTGPEKKHALAGIIASFALALEVSTGAAVANDTFTDAHMRLARGENSARGKL